MYLLVLAHPGCPGHTPESQKAVVVVVVYISLFIFPSRIGLLHFWAGGHKRLRNLVQGGITGLESNFILLYVIRLHCCLNECVYV